MELNLHIIAEDLAAYAPKRRICDNPSLRHLCFPALFDGTPAKRSLLYIVESTMLACAISTVADEDDDDAASVPVADLLTKGASFLVIGEPPQELLAAPVNLVWVSGDVSLSSLFSEVVELFATYNLWDEQLQQALIAKKQLKFLGEVSAPVFRRPIYLIDSYLQIVFAVVNEDFCTLPEGYRHPMIDANDPAQAHYLLGRFEDAMLVEREPFLMDSAPGYRTLSQNIYIDDRLIATVSLDEAGPPFNERDYALLSVLAGAIGSGMTYQEDWNTSVPQKLDEQIRLLLSGGHTSEGVLDAALKMVAWHVEDAYCCLVAQPLSRLVPDGLLAALAKRVSAAASQMVYSIRDGRMVFIVNMDYATLSLDETIKLLARELERVQARIGVSNVFNGFWQAGSQYRLALAAIEIGVGNGIGNGPGSGPGSGTGPGNGSGPGSGPGSGNGSGLGNGSGPGCGNGTGLGNNPNNNPIHSPEQVYRFEDCFVDYLVQRCQEGMAAEAMVPHGVMQLKRYDEQYHTDYLHTLNVYLQHDMRVAPAAQELFLHRNTLAHKIEQIAFISRMDFKNDPNVRLRIRLALAMMGEK
ncbi:MAG: helix-turn-helix domain-containing protein [Coriobacteriales bacterium]|jgi:hypothetical protein|nr:helix-turn-helix domain-containing protein [Coriobacteriales bacterium]